MEKISIIIPIYNTCEYLEKCIKSIMSQTYTCLEIICVDDGSTDGSERILDELALIDSRIVVVHQENHGESAARNVGINLATGEYIAFVDCDDWVENNMYEKLYSAMKLHDSDIVVSNWIAEKNNEIEYVKNKKKIDNNVFGREEFMKYIYDRGAYRNFAYMWNKLYKRKCLYNDDELILFDEKLALGGDIVFLAQMALNAEKITYIDEYFYHYIQRDDSSCHSNDLYKRMDHIKSYQIVLSLVKEKISNEQILNLIKRQIAYHSSNIAFMAIEQNNVYIFKQCKKLMVDYKSIYFDLNKDNSEWLNRFQEILDYQICEG